ncbi:MAG: hydroxyisourate hydrolase [Myxococcota bacterium]|nr:hydroxyisourate hydrolase [Myxococcota bacterium]
MSQITTHVLDTSLGRPAAGVGIVLERHETDGWRKLGAGVTDTDGRLRTLLSEGHLLQTGTYRLTFDTRSYFSVSARSTFFPSVTLTFEVTRPSEHHHVPLLLSPFGYSTYRGS